MLINELKTLPEEIQVIIWEVVSDFNDKLYDEFSLDYPQFEFINKVEDDIILKKTKIVDLPIILEKMPNHFKGDLRVLALKIATVVFWPLQDYLGNVDRLILRLGGKVPKHISLKKKQSSDDKQLPETFQGKVKDLINKYPEFKDLRLSPNKIVNDKGLMVNPSVQNWIADYIHFLGAGQHSSLERAKYISKSPNALKLADKYKNCLRYLLLSYDENTELYFNRSESLLTIEEEPAKQNIKQPEADVNVGFDKFLSNLKSKLNKFEEQLFPSDIIMSEAENNINKVRDILWQSIGVGDRDKTISCLKLLIERKALDLMIKEDNRFRNILKRFIGVKYGQNMERALAENIDPLIARRIFLEMILSDKLSLPEEDLFVAVFLLTNISTNSGQLIYLDKKDQKFQWRTIQVVGNKFAWVDKV